MLLEYTHQLATRQIVLASQSPRRRELLASLVPNFQVVVSNFDELLDKRQFAQPIDYAIATATQKALDVAKRTPADLVIAADTIVVSPSGIILEKPSDVDDAFRMLKMLSGSEHDVCTGVALSGRNGHLRSFGEKTRVKFAPLSDACIKAYIATGEPFDKAGGYGIQGVAGSFIRGIDGCYFNVVGLPLHRLASEMADLMELKLL